VGKILQHKGATKAALLSPTLDNALIVLIIVSIAGVLFFKILNSEYGLAMRVYGDGKIISESLGINADQVLWIGLGVGNALSAIAGALVVKISGSFGCTMGNGSLVFGMAAIIIGERLLAPKNISAAILGCFLGAFVYKAVIEFATFGNSETLVSEYNNVIMAIVLIFLIALVHDGKNLGRG
jgi:putative ABC transport system permease protein